MIPKIGAPFIPVECYVFISILTLISIVMYFVKINQDLKFVKNNTIKVISTPFIISFVISILSFFALLLPIIQTPLETMNIIDFLSRRDEDSIYLILFVITHLFLIIISGIVAAKKISYKGAKTENLDFMFAIIMLVIDIIVSFEFYCRIQSLKDTENILVDLIAETVSLGSGIYVLLSTSIIQLILAIFSNQFSSKSTSQTIENVPYALVNEVREFKKLLDEGIITQEEFEKRKNTLLNK